MNNIYYFVEGGDFQFGNINIMSCNISTLFIHLPSYFYLVSMLIVEYCFGTLRKPRTMGAPVTPLFSYFPEGTYIGLLGMAKVDRKQQVDKVFSFQKKPWSCRNDYQYPPLSFQLLSYQMCLISKPSYSVLFISSIISIVILKLLLLHTKNLISSVLLLDAYHVFL